jgi:hypothetical protein
MKKVYIFETKPQYDPNFWNLTREDLDPDEQAIYDALAAKLVNPSSEQLRIVTAFSWASAEMRKSGQAGNHKLFRWLRDCSIYARNGLGLFKVKPISGMELLLDCEDAWPPVILALDNAWEVN